MEEKKCSTCEKRKLSSTELGVFLLGFYLLGTSIYGTVELVKKLISLF